VQNLKDWLELIYFISGPAVAVIAFFALGQIRIAKEQLEAQRQTLRISSKRDALRLTADQISEYSSKVIPLLNALDKKIKDEQITYFSKFKVEVCADSIKVSPLNTDADIKETIKVASEIASASNALEAFSSYFVSGVADEKMAYLSLGTTFCNSVRNLAPLLVQLNANNRRSPAMLNLFTIWSCRLESEALNKQKKEIEDKLKNNGSVTIKTVGADT